MTYMILTNNCDSSSKIPDKRRGEGGCEMMGLLACPARLHVSYDVMGKPPQTRKWVWYMTLTSGIL